MINNIANQYQIDQSASIARMGEASASSPFPNFNSMLPRVASRSLGAGQPGSPSLPRLGYSQREMLEILPISERTLFSMRQRGEIPFVKLGDRVVYPADDIQAWWDRLKRGGAL